MVMRMNMSSLAPLEFAGRARQAARHDAAVATHQARLAAEAHQARVAAENQPSAAEERRIQTPVHDPRPQPGTSPQTAIVIPNDEENEVAGPNVQYAEEEGALGSKNNPIVIE
ncbi:unnamed protein product [Tilletia controversa]|nr:hypothetical protein CF335_g6583 [Tilletia laevis]CAD6903193.1 unnamed protein product [Tilletia controversa]CAD6917129.1 unnamed protein product [Tilletia caries]CAD6972017.1 unnamed protein product [Tilletia controversa]